MKTAREVAHELLRSLALGIGCVSATRREACGQTCDYFTATIEADRLTRAPATLADDRYLLQRLAGIIGDALDYKPARCLKAIDEYRALTPLDTPGQPELVGRGGGLSTGTPAKWGVTNVPCSHCAPNPPDTTPPRPNQSPSGTGICATWCGQVDDDPHVSVVPRDAKAYFTQDQRVCCTRECARASKPIAPSGTTKERP